MINILNYSKNLEKMEIFAFSNGPHISARPARTVDQSQIANEHLCQILSSDDLPFRRFWYTDIHTYTEADAEIMNCKHLLSLNDVK